MNVSKPVGRHAFSLLGKQLPVQGKTGELCHKLGIVENGSSVEVSLIVEEILLLLERSGDAHKSSTAASPPTLGTWLNLAPIEYQLGLNLLEYVDSSPTNLLDPRGWSWKMHGQEFVMPWDSNADWDPLANTWNFLNATGVAISGTASGAATGAASGAAAGALASVGVGKLGELCKLKGKGPPEDLEEEGVRLAPRKARLADWGQMLQTQFHLRKFGKGWAISAVTARSVLMLL